MTMTAYYNDNDANNNIQLSVEALKYMGSGIYH